MHEGTKPLPEDMFIYHQTYYDEYIWFLLERFLISILKMGMKL